MKTLFWASALFVAYAYAGYPLLLWCVSTWRRIPVLTDSQERTVDVIMAVRNEAANLAGKIANLQSQDYPPEKLRIIVASDGSTDETVDYLRQSGACTTPVLLPVQAGKAVALNAAVKLATADILVFVDARQKLDRDAVRELVSCFADPNVGIVSGELHLETEDGRSSGNGLGLYWKIEKVIRKLESATGSVIGVTGAIYALRRELFVNLPPGTLLDDVLVPMNVARLCKRVVFHPGAIARDRLFEGGREFARKTRTLTGIYQMVFLEPWMIGSGNPLLFRFLSHKLSRLLVPWALIAIFVTSVLLQSVFYRGVLLLQAVFYLLALLGYSIPLTRAWKPVSVAYTIVLLNAAALVALYNCVLGRVGWN